jgi:hypothetical protein
MCCKQKTVGNLTKIKEKRYTGNIVPKFMNFGEATEHPVSLFY